MFHAIRKYVPQNYSRGTVNGKLIDDSMYLSIGSNMYIQSSLRYVLFGDQRPLKYVCNTLPTSHTAPFQLFNCSLYQGSVEEEVTINIFSRYDLSSVLGQTLNTAREQIIIDIANRTIRTSSETLSAPILDTHDILKCESIVYGRRGTIYFQNAILSYKYDYRYMSPMYPFYGTSAWFLYDLFEHAFHENVDVAIPSKNTVILPDTVQMKRPKFIIGSNDTWYVYNSTSKELQSIAPANGSYFLIDEIYTRGNTYDELCQITQIEYETVFGSVTELTLLCPEYMIAFTIHHSFWMDRTDAQKYIWGLLSNTKWTFIAGDI